MKAANPEFSCVVTRYYYDNVEYNFTFDEENRLTQVRYNYQDSDTSYSNTYIATGFTDDKVSKYTLTKDGVESFYEEYTWSNNRTTINYYNKVNSAWQNLERYVLEENAAGRITKISYYSADNGEFVLEWYNNYLYSKDNVTLQERFVTENTKKSRILSKKKPLPTGIDQPGNLKSSIADELYYSISYTSYDDKNNWRSAIGLFWPTNGLSINNSLNYSYSYASGAVYNYTRSYSYNDLGYPVEFESTLEYEGEYYNYYYNMEYNCSQQ